MQPLDLNLASNPFRNNTLLWLGYGSATLLLATFSVWNVMTFFDYGARLRELRDTVGTFESQRLDLETRGKRALDGIRRFDVSSLELQAAKANEVIEWKAFSWTRLFNTLEEVQPNHVRMSSVRPIFSVAQGAADEAESGGAGMPVALEGVARSYDDFTALEHAMQEDPNFGRVEPDRLTRTESGEIVFQMHVWYLFPEEAAAREAQSAEGAAAPGEGAPAPADEAPERAPDQAPARAADGAAASPEVEEPWTAGQAPGAGEVQSATAADGVHEAPARKGGRPRPARPVR